MAVVVVCGNYVGWWCDGGDVGMVGCCYVVCSGVVVVVVIMMMGWYWW